MTAQEKILLEGAQEAQISIAHGAGTIDLHALDEPGVLLEGSFGGGVRKDVQRVGNTLKVKLDAEFDWVFPTVDHGWFWSLGLTRDIPLDIRVKGGANEATLISNTAWAKPGDRNRRQLNAGLMPRSAE